MALSFPTHLHFKRPNYIGEGKSCGASRKWKCFPSKDRSFTSEKQFLCSYCLPQVFIGSSSHKFSAVTRSFSGDDKVEVFSAQEPSFASDADALEDPSSSTNDGYVALFIRMLGLDNDPRDREQAVVTLWKYSLGGKLFVDNIMKFPGIVNLIVNLSKSDSDAACEAAGGLLRVISSINVYRDLVAESAVVEEITSLLTRSTLTSGVKEQITCTLCNLSVDEKLRTRIANSEILALLVKLVEDEDMKVKEAAGGVLANLALSHANHTIMVEAGVIPKLAKLLTVELKESKVIRKVARNALLELFKDPFNRILGVEEGIIQVPSVGSAAYKSFEPALHSWPSLPDGTKFEHTSKSPSRYGASGLLLGLNIQEKNVDLDGAKMNALVGRTRQQFLVRVGAIELEEDNKSESQWCSSQRFTLLPWIDGVARLVLILGLQDESAITRAAFSIADASVNEHMRVAFMEAGAIKCLVQLINHPCNDVRLAVVQALDKLSISNCVCQQIEAEGVMDPLLNLLKDSASSSSPTLTSTILNILARILDPNKEMTSNFYDGTVNDSQEGNDPTRNLVPANGNDLISSESVPRQTFDHIDLFDSAVLGCLVDILKTSTPDLQRKASSVLEFIVMTGRCMEKLISADIESGLEAVFRKKTFTEMEDDTHGEKPELRSLELEEAGRAVSAASRLLTRLLDDNHFFRTVKAPIFIELLHSILVSDIPLQNKDWVALSLVKLSSISGLNSDFENPISMQVTLHETIPRLIEQMKISYDPEVQEAAVLELNRIVSEGLVDSTRAVASGGGIFPLVKLMEDGSDKTKDASLSILHILSMDSENHAAIIAAGAVPVLRKIVLSQRSQWIYALRLLRTLPTSP